MGGLYISASGILNAVRRNEVTANNIANLRTPGFRASRAQSVERASGGVEVGSILRDPRPGPTELTGRPFDLVSREGFFRVTREDGSVAFTRDGNFGLNANGEVVTASGARLQPPISVPPGAQNITVNADGGVFATLSTGAAPTRIGTIEVARFTNPGGLEAIGNNLLRETPASGPPSAVSALPELESGALQGSNVDLVTEQVNLLMNRNAFEANLAAFRVQSEVLGELLDLIE